MNKRKMEQLLKESGFYIKKAGSKHVVWTDGTNEIAISYGNKISPTTLTSFKSKMRKAQKKVKENPKSKNLWVWGVAAFAMFAAISSFAKKPSLND